MLDYCEKEIHVVKGIKSNLEKTNSEKEDILFCVYNNIEVKYFKFLSRPILVGVSSHFN